MCKVASDSRKVLNSTKAWSNRQEPDPYEKARQVLSDFPKAGTMTSILEAQPSLLSSPTEFLSRIIELSASE